MSQVQITCFFSSPKLHARSSLNFTAKTLLYCKRRSLINHINAAVSNSSRFLPTQPPKASLNLPLSLSRRLCLSLALGLTATLPSSPSLASRLRSISCTTPAVITFNNSFSDRSVKIFWITYDGDAELFAILPPKSSWTVDTFETHPWRVVDAETGNLLLEHVAQSGEIALDLQKDSISNNSTNTLQDGGPSNEFEGFDGVGGKESDYAAAQVTEVALDHLGGVALLTVDGFQAPVPLPVGALEAAQLFHAGGIEFRRPTTIHAWTRSLESAGVEIKRCLVTRIVGTTYYSRIVLELPNGAGFSSVDARPSDAMAVALASGAPMFVSKRIARGQQPGSAEKVFPGMYEDAEPPSGRIPFVTGEEGEGRPPLPSSGGRTGVLGGSGRVQKA